MFQEATRILGVIVGGIAVGSLGNTLRVAVGSDRPTARPFAVVVTAMTTWAVATVGPTLPGVPAAVGWVWELGSDVGSVAVPVAWLAYTRRYTGRTGWRAPTVAGLAVVGAAALIATGLPEPDALPLAAAVGVVATSYLVLGAVALCYGGWVLYSLAGTHDRVSARQVAVVTAAVLSPFVVRLAVAVWALVRRFGVGVPVERSLGGLPPVPVGFLMAGLLLSVGVSRYPVLATFPRATAVARATVVRDLREPVIVLDHDDRLLDVNDSAAATFGWDADAVAARSVSAVHRELGELDFAPGATGTARVDTADGRRRFRFAVSAVGDRTTDDPLARAVVLRDVTDRHTREQRLTVLNRVLRHNIRNDLDVVLAHAAEIDERSVREPIRETARDLVSLTTKAREAERAMALTTESPDTVDLAGLVARVAEAYADRAADVTVTTPDELVVATHESVVRAVLDELVQNAVVHADSPPTVEVRLTETVDGVVVTVADDGPGMPAHDRAVLDRETETQLGHRLGLGLWFVQWAVDRLGGELSVSDRDPTGTAATVRLSV